MMPNTPPIEPPAPSRHPRKPLSVTFAAPSWRVKLIISCSPSYSATIACEPRITVTDHLRHPELGGAFSAAVKKEIRAIFSTVLLCQREQLNVWFEAVSEALEGSWHSKAWKSPAIHSSFSPLRQGHNVRHYHGVVVADGGAKHSQRAIVIAESRLLHFQPDPWLQFTSWSLRRDEEWIREVNAESPHNGGVVLLSPPVSSFRGK